MPAICTLSLVGCGLNPNFPQTLPPCQVEPLRSLGLAGRLHVINAGASGTTSSYMCLCHRQVGLDLSLI